MLFWNYCNEINYFNFIKIMKKIESEFFNYCFILVNIVLEFFMY